MEAGVKSKEPTPEDVANAAAHPEEAAVVTIGALKDRHLAIGHRLQLQKRTQGAGWQPPAGG
jgi:hypothetical protein